MNSQQIEQVIARLGQDIAARATAESATDGLAIVGIRRGGVHLASRLRADLARRLGHPPPLGTLDIALYRDDLAARGVAPRVGPTDIRFPIDGKTVLLVDDVLYTGRTVRAALDELVDFGRPRRVWLAVLVDRGGHELPIRPDFCGMTLDIPPQQNVQLSRNEQGQLMLSVS
jgi:pyrimidine operon attenuation protein/uracil phosphoribosyltransferase